MIKGILFDMDGVLLDTERLGREIYLDEAHKAGYPQMDNDHYAKLLGCPDQENRQTLLNAFGADYPYDEVVIAYRKRLKALILSGQDVTMPHLSECLEGLKQRGMRIALATSTNRPVVEEYLDFIPQLRNVFDAMVCGTEAGRGKPAPDIYLEAARRLGLQPEECIGVEDSLNGCRSLTAAGCVRVLIPDLLPNDGRFDGLTDYVLDSLGDLCALADRLNG